MSDLINKKVKLIRMEDPYTDLKSGDIGTIIGVDDIGQIMVKWESGSALSLIPEIDEYEILERKLNHLDMFLEFNSYSILEKNIPVDKDLWNSCKSWAKTKYDVWPSAYACGAAAKRYKGKGGKWRKKK